MSSVMLLNHLATSRDDEACSTAAARVKAPYDRALDQSQTTGDLGGPLGTTQFADAVIARLD